MKEETYSIEEILRALEELQSTTNNKKKFRENTKQNFKVDNSNIPRDTLKLIEDAEKYNT